MKIYLYHQNFMHFVGFLNFSSSWSAPKASLITVILPNFYSKKVKITSKKLSIIQILFRLWLSVCLKLAFSCSWGEFQGVNTLRLVWNGGRNVHEHDGFASLLEIRFKKICQFGISEVRFSLVVFQWPNDLSQLRQRWVDMLSLFKSFFWHSAFLYPFTSC